MTASLERPDPYRIKPCPSAARRRSRAGSAASAASASVGSTAATSADTDRARLDPRLEMLREGLRAMTHERLEQAREYLRAIATEEDLESGDLVAIDSLAFLSSVTWGLGDPISAVEMAERALELAPDRFATNQKAGEMSMRLGHLDKAEARFLAALRASEPGTSDARSAEACLREARKRTARGIAHGTRGLGLGGFLRRLRRPRPSEQTDGATAQPAA